TVRSIVTYDGPLQAAAFPQSVTVELEDEIDLSRGEMLVAADAAGEALPQVSTRFRAMVVWMHEEPLVAGRTYIAKHTTRTVRATVQAIRYAVEVSSLAERPAEKLEMNEIGEIEFATNLPLFFDAYRENRMMGSMILIDAVTNATVGAAMLIGIAEGDSTALTDLSRPALVLVPGREELAQRVLNTLLATGVHALVIDDALIPDASVAGVVRALQLAGVTAISARVLDAETLRAITAFASGGILQEEGPDEAGLLASLEVLR
ncbi:MAG: sulfate adenylyltransferase, partial [Granulicella sp.]